MDSEESSGAPLPSEEPPLPLEEPPAAPPLPPPPSTQMSNPQRDWLDFGSGAGGNTAHEESNESPPSKRARLDDPLQNEDSPMESQDSAEAEYPPSMEDGELSDDDMNKQEFEIIDDLAANSDDEMNYDSDDLDEDEIDALLDEGLQVQRDNISAPLEKEKVVLKEFSRDPFDILPEGWVTVIHNSGMPVYLHRESRVCTLSRPYFLGPGSARQHDIPLSAIPCLHYKREATRNQHNEDGTENGKQNGEVPSSETDMAAENQQEGEKSENDQATGDKSEGDANSGGATQETQNGSDASKNPTIPVKVESVESYNKEKTLDPLEVRKYCENLFQFQHILVKKYKTWKDRRKHNKIKKLNSRPSLPSNTKLITCPVLVNKQDDKVSRKRDFVLNPAGKSEICILHEYVQHAMRVQPKYIFKELENAQTPYSATVVINEVEYGTGYASSKKAAKNEAAKATLGILIPELGKQTTSTHTPGIHDLSFFDEVKIEDPRVHDLCNKAGQPSPFQILCECLRRNFGMGDTNCQMEMKTLKHQKSEFVMKVGKHTATVICKNKREGKQLAAQAILQRLHPHIHSWGSLLRLYGTDWKAIKEKEEELSVTALHARAKQHQPNTAILTKLRQEMKKLQMRRVCSESALVEALDLEAAEYSVMLLQLCLIVIDDSISCKSNASQTESSTRVLVMKESCVQAGGSTLAGLQDFASQAGPISTDSYTQIDSALERTWETIEEVPSDLFLPALTHYHVATMTSSTGELQFHKATQYPDVLYTPDQSNTIQVPASSDASRIRVLSPQPARPPLTHSAKPPIPNLMYMRPRNIHYIARGRAFQNVPEETETPATTISMSSPNTTAPTTTTSNPYGASRPLAPSDLENQPPLYQFLPQQPYYPPYWPPGAWAWK